MRAIHGVCNKWDQVFDFTAGLSSFRRVQSQAPSLTAELIDRLRPPPRTQKQQRTGEGEGGEWGQQDPGWGGVELGPRWQNFRYLRFATLTAALYKYPLMGSW